MRNESPIASAGQCQRTIKLMSRLLVAVALVSPAAAFAQAPSGPELFKKNKCNECHSVKAAGITKSEGKGGGEEEEEKGPKGETKEPPDLSDVGTKHDAAWMKSYLKKKEKLNGSLHKKRFKGTPEELDALTAWLATLKTKAEKK